MAIRENGVGFVISRVSCSRSASKHGSEQPTGSRQLTK